MKTSKILNNIRNDEYIAVCAPEKANLLIVLAVMAIVMCLPTFQACAQGDVNELRSLLSSPNNKKIIKFKSHVIEYKYDEEKNVKLLNYECVCDTAFDLAGGGKIYARFSPLVQRYASESSAPSEFTESVVSYVYNGDYWVEMLERKGPKDSTNEMNIAVISESRPPFLGDRGYESGEGFFRTGTRLAWRGKRLSLKDSIFLGSFPPLTTKHYESEGTRLIEIVFQDACTKQRFAFDEGKGYALRSQETTMNLCNPDANQLREVVTVTKLKQVDEQFWIPSSATREYYSNDKIRIRQEFELLGYSLPEPNQILFDAHIPVGWHVTDKRYGIEFNVGSDPSAVFEDLKKR